MKERSRLPILRNRFTTRRSSISWQSPPELCWRWRRVRRAVCQRSATASLSVSSRFHSISPASSLTFCVFCPLSEQFCLARSLADFHRPDHNNAGRRIPRPSTGLPPGGHNPIPDSGTRHVDHRNDKVSIRWSPGIPRRAILPLPACFDRKG